MIDFWFSVSLSLMVAVLATLVVAVVGGLIGYSLARRNFPGRDLIDAMCALPMVLPPTVVGFYLLDLFGVNGPIGKPLHDITGFSLIFTWQAAVLAAVIIALPFMVKTSRAAFEGVDASFQQASYTLGRTELETFWQVTMPLAWRGLLAGVALSYARALGEFGATVMIAGNIPQRTQTMPLAIYQAVQSGQDSVAITLVVALTVISVAVLFSINKLGARW